MFIQIYYAKMQVKIRYIIEFRSEKRSELKKRTNTRRDISKDALKELAFDIQFDNISMTFRSFKFSSVDGRRSRVAASHAEVSSSIPGRLGIFNKNISP